MGISGLLQGQSYSLHTQAMSWAVMYFVPDAMLADITPLWAGRCAGSAYGANECPISCNSTVGTTSGARSSAMRIKPCPWHPAASSMLLHTSGAGTILIASYRGHLQMALYQRCSAMVTIEGACFGASAAHDSRSVSRQTANTIRRTTSA